MKVFMIEIEFQNFSTTYFVHLTGALGKGETFAKRHDKFNGRYSFEITYKISLLTGLDLIAL